MQVILYILLQFHMGYLKLRYNTCIYIQVIFNKHKGIVYCGRVPRNYRYKKHLIYSDMRLIASSRSLLPQSDLECPWLRETLSWTKWLQPLLLPCCVGSPKDRFLELCYFHSYCHCLSSISRKSWVSFHCYTDNLNFYVQFKCWLQSLDGFKFHISMTRQKLWFYA